MEPGYQHFQRSMSLRKWKARIFHLICLLAILLVLLVLATLLYNIIEQGWHRINWDFLTGFPSRIPERAGIYGALIGSVYVISVASVTSFLLGVGAAVYLEEYATRGWFVKSVQINISNLAGVPSVVYGLLGLEIFARTLGLGDSVLAGGFTMGLLILPIVIIASEEALRAVPPSIREGAFALGASRWQTIWHLVLPQAFPSILTGVILAISRAIGEAAPLIVLGALAFVPFAPDGLLSQFTVLPIQIFSWISRPQAEFHEVAAAAIMVLLVVLLSMNAVAVLLRLKFQKKSDI